VEGPELPEPGDGGTDVTLLGITTYKAMETLKLNEKILNFGFGLSCKTISYVMANSTFSLTTNIP